MGLGGQLSGERRLSGAADGLIPAAPAGAIHYLRVVLKAFKGLISTIVIDRDLSVIFTAVSVHPY